MRTYERSRETECGRFCLWTLQCTRSGYPMPALVLLRPSVAPRTTMIASRTGRIFTRKLSFLFRSTTKRHTHTHTYSAYIMRYVCYINCIFYNMLVLVINIIFVLFSYETRSSNLSPWAARWRSVYAFVFKARIPRQTSLLLCSPLLSSRKWSKDVARAFSAHREWIGAKTAGEQIRDRAVLCYCRGQNILSPHKTPLFLAYPFYFGYFKHLSIA